MNIPAEIEPAIEAALARAARELAEVAATLGRIRTLLELVASAVEAK